MNAEPSAEEQLEESCMELTRSQDLIRKLKNVKKEREITYPRIMDMLEKSGKFVSMSTLRRVFAEDSEKSANTFSYETTLRPLAEVLLSIEDVPTPADSPNAQEIDGLKIMIRAQNEEIARLHEMQEHLEERIAFLLEQIEKKDRRMDEKDEIIKKLMEKCL